MDKLKAMVGALARRVFNLYTLRAIAVVVLSIAMPSLDPRFAAALHNLMDYLIGGDTSLGMLATFGGAYVMRDVVKARRKAIAEGGPDYSWVKK